LAILECLILDLLGHLGRRGRRSGRGHWIGNLGGGHAHNDLFWVDYIFGLNLVVMLKEVHHGALSIVKVKHRNAVSCWEIHSGKGVL
jgi:hypothetical protein